MKVFFTLFFDYFKSRIRNFSTYQWLGDLANTPHCCLKIVDPSDSARRAGVRPLPTAHPAWLLFAKFPSDAVILHGRAEGIFALTFVGGFTVARRNKVFEYLVKFTNIKNLENNFEQISRDKLKLKERFVRQCWFDNFANFRIAQSCAVFLWWIITQT